MVKQVISRGEIYWAVLKTAYEGESIQVGKRPVVITSNDLNNKYCTTINVLPITSQLDKKPLPVHVEIEGCGLEKKSVVLAEQICTIPKTALGDYIGKCTSTIYSQIERAMQIQNGEVFDINKALKLIEAIKAANNFINKHQLPKNINFRVALVDEYKAYCLKFGVNYNVLWNKNNKINEVHNYVEVYA